MEVSGILVAFCHVYKEDGTRELYKENVSQEIQLHQTRIDDYFHFKILSQ